MTTSLSSSVAPRPPRVASVRHTAIFLGILLSLAVVGARSHAALTPPGSAGSRPSVLAIYLPLAVAEWLLVFFVWRGVRAAGGSLRDLVGGRWSSLRDPLRDAALGAAVWGGWVLANAAWVRWHPDAPATSVQGLLPRGPVEVAVWIALSCSAGVAEEIAFRGYLLRQMRSFTGSAMAAVLLQAVLFAVVHSYQSLTACVKIAIYGALFGGVALWRRSLRPGMFAHAWTDIAAGIFRI